MYSLGLNNPLSIGFTLGFGRVYRFYNKQGNCRCILAGTGIHSLAKLRAQILWFATTEITPWQTVLKCTADCQAPHSGNKEYMRPVRPERQSALKFRLLSVAMRSTVILIVAIRGLNTADGHNPRYTFEH
jgi:hypothetical protein